MRIESVNVGRKRPFQNDIGATGIYKEPATGPVHVGALRLGDDFVADARHHGGPDQAVYVYLAEDYAWWSETLGRDLEPGSFGDNLTVSGLASSDLAIGDRLVAGDLVLQVTAPRIPCNTLARRMDDPGFVKAFRNAERPGVYCRVIEEAAAEAGMPVEHLPHEGERVGVVEMFRDWFVLPKLDAVHVTRILGAPIAERARAAFEARLAGIRAETEQV